MACLMLISCEENTKYETIDSSVSRIRLKSSETGLNRTFKVYTFEWNGHLWYRCTDSENFLHHPDCKCLKNKTEESSYFNW